MPLSEAEENSEASSIKVSQPEAVNHYTSSSATFNNAQPIQSGVPVAIPNYGTIQSVVINVYKSDNM